MSDKYKPATLPPSRNEALKLATEREAWAKDARKQDMQGSAREFELTALLLRFYAEHIDKPQPESGAWDNGSIRER